MVWGMTRAVHGGRAVALAAAIMLAPAAAAQDAQDIIVRTEAGEAFVLRADGTYAPATIATDAEGNAFILFGDNSWQRLEAYLPPIDVRFREAVRSAVRQFEEDASEEEVGRVTDCLVRAFDPLDRDEKQELIDVGIDPDRDMQERLESRHPGIGDAVESCI